MNGWLADKSALWKIPHSPDFAEWMSRINRGLVRSCFITRLEVAVSARNPAHWVTMRQDLLDPLVDAPFGPRAERTAVGIMDALVQHGLHRSVRVPDVMIAAVAVVERLVVLHDDKDFERIRDAYGEPDVERLRLG